MFFRCRYCLSCGLFRGGGRNRHLRVWRSSNLDDWRWNDNLGAWRDGALGDGAADLVEVREDVVQLDAMHLKHHFSQGCLEVDALV